MFWNLYGPPLTTTNWLAQWAGRSLQSNGTIHLRLKGTERTRTWDGCSTGTSSWCSRGQGTVGRINGPGDISSSIGRATKYGTGCLISQGRSPVVSSLIINPVDSGGLGEVTLDFGIGRPEHLPEMLSIRCREEGNSKFEFEIASSYWFRLIFTRRSILSFKFTPESLIGYLAHDVSTANCLTALHNYQTLTLTTFPPSHILYMLLHGVSHCVHGPWCLKS
jgi:hypothetical protein